MGEVTWLGPVELDLETLRSFITVSAEKSLARGATVGLDLRAIAPHPRTGTPARC